MISDEELKAKRILRSQGGSRSITKRAKIAEQKPTIIGNYEEQLKSKVSNISRIGWDDLPMDTHPNSDFGDMFEAIIPAKKTSRIR